MQVVTENKQNLDLQNIQEQVSSNDKSQQCQASSIEKNYVCYFEDCNYRFFYPYQLKHHIAKHTGNEKYKCDIDKCKKKFLSLKSLRNHKESHGVFSNYACSLCNITCKDKRGLKEHNHSNKHLTMASLKHNRYTCDLCTKTFDNRRVQECHYSKSHPKYRAYSCTVCDNRFKSLRSKNRHYIKIHTSKTKAECKQKKIYKSDLCAETYPQVNKLTQHHQNQHPNEKLLKNYQTTLASNDKQNFYQDKNKDQALKLADQSLPSISSVEDINNTNSNQYLGGVTQLDMPSTQETIKEDNNQYQLLEWPDGFQSCISSEESFFNENYISDISYDVN